MEKVNIDEIIKDLGYDRKTMNTRWSDLRSHNQQVGYYIDKNRYLRENEHFRVMLKLGIQQALEQKEATAEMLITKLPNADDIIREVERDKYQNPPGLKSVYFKKGFKEGAAWVINWAKK